MMRLFAVSLLVVLGACTNSGFNPIIVAAVDQVNPFDEEEVVDRPAGQPITREAVIRADVAMIRARLVDDESPTYLLAASNNGGYITYASQLRQTMTLRGSRVTATRGLGWDLLSSTASSPDPLVQAIPVSRWPAEVTRTFEFPSDSPSGRIDTYTCRFERGAAREFVIVQQRHQGIEVGETCTGPAGSFENLHFADAATGQVWRSLQWTGPRQGLIDLEIVLPYTGR